MADIEHELQAPVNSKRRKFPSMISSTLTFPPSATKYGRILSKAFSIKIMRRSEIGKREIYKIDLSTINGITFILRS